MPLSAVNTYLQKLENRQAETKLLMVDVVSYPKLKKRDQTSLLAAWMKLAEVENKKPIQNVSAGKLKLIGIGVKYER